MEKATFAIDEMHCGSCVNRVSAALRAVDGVKVERVAVGTAEVSLDPIKATPQAVVEALAAAGYPARAEPIAGVAGTSTTPAAVGKDHGCGCCRKS